MSNNILRESAIEMQLHLIFSLLQNVPDNVRDEVFKCLHTYMLSMISTLKTQQIKEE